MFPGDSDDEFDEDLCYHENFRRGILNLGPDMRNDAAEKLHPSEPESSLGEKTAKSAKKSHPQPFSSYSPSPPPPPPSH
ncbi:hypothetical protein EON64_10815, partial [archaeon]